MKILLILAALLAVPVAVQAQGSTTATPDCQISLSAAAATTSVVYHNTKSCTFWTLAYNSAGFSAVSIEPEYAPDGATSNVAGTFLVWPSNQLASGSLPLTVATESQISTFGYHPWIRINFISKTGSGLIVATLNGWRTAPGDASSAGGSAVTCSACATSANQTNGTQQTKVVDGSGNVLPTLPSGAVTVSNADGVVVSYEALTSGGVTVAMTATTSTSVMTPTAGQYEYITTCVTSNGSTTVSTDILLQDGSGGATIFLIPTPAATVATTGGGGASVNFGDHPLKVPTISNGLYAANVTTGSSTKIFCNGFKSANSY